MSIDKSNPPPPSHPLKTGIAGRDMTTLDDLSRNLPAETPVKDVVDLALSTGDNEITRTGLDKDRTP